MDSDSDNLLGMGVKDPNAAQIAGEKAPLMSPSWARIRQA